MTGNIKTHPTKSICRMLWSIRKDITYPFHQMDNHLYDMNDIERTCNAIELIDFHQVFEFNGIKVTCYSAGHVLGAHVPGGDRGHSGAVHWRLLREIDRHLMPAEIPPVRIHVLIVESTYGTQTHDSREQRESRFLSMVEDIVRKGGKCLPPSFALGRAQKSC